MLVTACIGLACNVANIIILPLGAMSPAGVEELDGSRPCILHVILNPWLSQQVHLGMQRLQL